MMERNRRDQVTVDGTEYTILRSFGERRNGFLYLVTDGKKNFIMKEYVGGWSASRTVREYETLRELGIRMPELICADVDANIVLKQYIDGRSADCTMRSGELMSTYVDQLRKMAEIAEAEGVCLDYFPTNFICHEKTLYYVHFELLGLEPENSLDTCLGKYWLQPKEC